MKYRLIRGLFLQLFFHKFFLKKMEKQQARAGKAEKRKKDVKSGKSDGSGSEDEDSSAADSSNDDSESESESELDEGDVWKVSSVGGMA